MLKGVMDLPLHSGKAPQWLMSRMKRLAKEISIAILDIYGEKRFFELLSDPLWFQALGNVLGFDWHSSGVTTTVIASLKTINSLNYVVKIAGGKGKSSKIADEIQKLAASINANPENIKYYSKIAAKVDNSLLQDDFNLYVHSILFSKKKWLVIQQGMKAQLARRYHWSVFSKPKKLTIEPHNGIISDEFKKVLDLTSFRNEIHQKVSVDLVNDNPVHIFKYFKQRTLFDFQYGKMPAHHYITNFDLDKRTKQSLLNAYQIKPSSYEELLSVKGIGKKSLRALALVSELITAKPLDIRNPAKFSFAHGGKDGTPFPVNLKTYEKSINILRDCINNSKLKPSEKEKILNKLANIVKSEK